MSLVSLGPSMTLTIACPHCGAPLTYEHIPARAGDTVTLAIPEHIDPELRESVYAMLGGRSPVVSRFRMRCVASDGQAIVSL